MSKFDVYYKMYSDLRTKDHQLYIHTIEMAGAIAIQLNLEDDKAFLLEAGLVNTTLKLIDSRKTDTKSLLQRLRALEEENEKLKSLLSMK